MEKGILAEVTFELNSGSKIVFQILEEKDKSGVLEMKAICNTTQKYFHDTVPIVLRKIIDQLESKDAQEMLKKTIKKTKENVN